MASQDVNARFQAKLAARANGETKIVLMPGLGVSTSPQGSEVDERYRQKLIARNRPPEVISEAPPEPAPEKQAMRPTDAKKQ